MTVIHHLACRALTQPGGHRAADGYVYGFVLQEASLSFTTSAEVANVAATILEQLPTDRYPHLTEMIMDHALRPGYFHADEFRFGLELILDGLDRAAQGAALSCAATLATARRTDPAWPGRFGRVTTVPVAQARHQRLGGLGRLPERRALTDWS